MTDHGQPDQPRSARLVLKDFVTVRFLVSEPQCRPWGRTAFKSGGRGGCILLSQGLAVLLDLTWSLALEEAKPPRAPPPRPRDSMRGSCEEGEGSFTLGFLIQKGRHILEQTSRSRMDCMQQLPSKSAQQRLM